MAPPILATTDLVATEPARILRPAAEQLGLAVQPPPLVLPAFDAVQMWPSRLTADPANGWLRSVVLEIAGKGH